MKNTFIITIVVAIVLLGQTALTAQDIYPGKATKVEKDISAEFPFESKYIVCVRQNHWLVLHGWLVLFPVIW